MERDNRLPARVNITLNISNKDAQEKKELPMRLLVLADFSKSGLTKSRPTKSGQQQTLAKQERLAVTLANYQQVLSYLNPTLKLMIPNTLKAQQSELAVDLSFNSMQDFHPKAIVEQVPILQRLAAMKNLLKELRSSLIDNAAFKQKVQELLCDKENVQNFQKELAELKS